MNEPCKGNTAAIILAAGFGRRLESIGPKPLLECKRRSFVEIAVGSAIAAGFFPIILVTNKQFEAFIRELRLPVKIAINGRPERGMLSSILTGMDLLPTNSDGFLLCPIDYPLVKPETFHHLFEAYQFEPDCILKPVYLQKSGHPVIFPCLLYDELHQIPENEGARYVLRKNPSAVRNMPVDDPGILININTPELFHQYCE